MNRSPLTRQRSPWREAQAFQIGDVLARSFRRDVGDGVLLALLAEEPSGWHLSVSFRDRRDALTRYPTWDELAHARDELLPADVGFVMFLPVAEEYVALHETTFHLHEYPERTP